MKNVVVFLILFSSCTIISQEKGINFGVKAGLNYGDNGKIEFSDVTNAGDNLLSENADDRVGYHIGVFLRGDITDNFYLKPELQYTQNSSSYSFDNRKLNYNVKKLDLPILAGIYLLGPLHVFGGPSLQYIVDNDLEDVRLSEVKNEFTVGVQFGVGLQIRRLNIDLRYERGITENQAQTIDANTGQTIRVDSRPNQFILSLALDL
ncbi:PorT family protein [Aquimarina sp. AD1]|uniref:porin family protein n=1 Tax=Aquimarina sp. (strain AD1) TaxID=1714848 RepID=UPI000E4A3F98|nr:porin family protein [Aquimarina sp. AD1]AXT56012.1 PorT family protein [Aquimarina sp. AD1]RKN37320.1 PorT family protein [Aquimarina sp. AD1]